MKSHQDTGLIALFGSSEAGRLIGAMMEAGFKEAGLDYRFANISVEKGKMEEVLQAAEVFHMKGFNLDGPCSKEILPYLDMMSPAASIPASSTNQSKSPAAKAEKKEEKAFDLNSTLDAFRTIVVDANGNGDYTTISDAVSAASDGDTILVQPGTYMETVHAFSKKVHIVGVDRETCILQYHGLDYANPPLEMAKGSVRNLTINCLNSGTQGAAKAYCVHIDNDNEEGQTLLFENVRFYNPVHQGVGIGLRHNFELVFDNCEFEAVEQAALYCHDWETSDSGADKSGQKLTLLNCTLKNNDATHATIMLQSQELATNCATCKFVGCSVYNANSSGGKISMTMWQGRTLTNNSFMSSSDWVLDALSGLNTEAVLNKY